MPKDVYDVVARNEVAKKRGVGVKRPVFEAAIDKFNARLSVHVSIRDGDPAEQIAAHAHEIGADLVVIGHTDRGFLASWFEGSTGAKLIRDLPCNLLVATKDG